MTLFPRTVVIGLAAAVAVLFFIPRTTEAYPNGAGGCVGRSAAVGGSHVQGTFKTGPLSAAGLVVTLDGKTLSRHPTNFTIGQSHVLTVKSASTSFKGVLFRLGSTGGVDTTKALSVRSGDSSLRIARDTCIPRGAGGVTHTDNDDKKSSTSVLRLDKVASRLPLDITVVIENDDDDDDESTFYYSGFVLNAVRPPPSRPSRRPTKRPSRRPTRRPSAAPVPPPVQDDESED